jgi:CBS domain-containing protein
VIGIVTDRDLCMNVVAEGRDPRATQVHEAMTTTVVSCSPQDSVDKATEPMRENQIRHRPRERADDRDARDAEDRFRADEREL